MSGTDIINNSFTLTEAAKAASREYHKKWQQENRDKVKSYQSRYWEKKAQAAEDVLSGRITPDRDPDHR